MLHRNLLMLAVTVFACQLTSLSVADDLTQQPGYVLGEFIYEDAPFPQCHASTIEETSDGLIAAWFGGTHEKNPDVGIWVSRWTDGKWSTPVEVANGVINPEKRFPTWNPVLFQPKTGPLLLFYKNGPSPREWWGELIRSTDGGRSWSKMERLPDGVLGPIKNKPIQLADGTILSGASTEHDGWRVHMERSSDNAKTWTTTDALNTKDEMGAIQPALLTFGDTIRILCRSQQGKIATATSNDAGKSWSKMGLIDLPNPNSGIDAATLMDGRGVLIYNHTKRGRSPLNVAVTKNGTDWKQVVTLENQPGEYSYPAVIQTSDGKVHVTYTWKRRRVRHVVLDPSAW
ncbi:MAG: sialidase family protein [Planctomycetota bacterium]|jgi:predicted neuraminidase